MNNLVTSLILDYEDIKDFHYNLNRISSYLSNWQSTYPHYRYDVQSDEGKLVIQVDIYADNTERSTGHIEGGSKGNESPFELSYRGCQFSV
jgi:hypothetical protein